MTNSDQFFGLPPCDPAAADALLLPLPFEMTVSYGTGTSSGPQAVLDASPQIELFDEETLVDFAELRLHTLPSLLTSGSVEECLAAIQAYVAGLRGKFLLVIGGEHLLTYGTAMGLAADPARTTIVHVDAHADLADTLGGRRWSHGTVMRRLWEQGFRFIQIGIRSLSRPEYELTQTGERITTYFAHRLAEQWAEIIASLRELKGPVYMTIDVDGLDPGIIPSTGTPQPNGLLWQQVMEIIRAVAEAKRCQWIGTDVVEFVASPTPPGCDFTAARLVMKVLAWWAANRHSPPSVG